MISTIQITNQFSLYTLTVDNQTETIIEENQAENDTRFKFPIEDMRETGDTVQALLLSERLKTDEVDLALGKTKTFLGEYSTVQPKDLSIRLVEGRLGEGQLLAGGIIEIQLPKDNEAVNEMKLALASALDSIEEDKKDTKCREIINASCASTSLHEGVHGLLDSKPGSKFAQDFERVTGMENEQGADSTLMDEGIAYAIQGIFAPEIPPLGSFVPVAREGEREEVVLRKRLGEAIRPKVKEYFESNKPLDDEFLSFAAQEMTRLR